MIKNPSININNIKIESFVIKIEDGKPRTSIFTDLFSDEKKIGNITLHSFGLPGESIYRINDEASKLIKDLKNIIEADIRTKLFK